MYCSTCGTQLADGAAFCVNCGRQVASPTTAASATPPAVSPSAPCSTPANTPAAYATPPYTPPVQQQPAQYNWQAALPAVAYAGFWLRFVAYIIDSMILGVLFGVGVLRPLHGGALETLSRNPWALYTSLDRPIVAIQLLALMVTWIYYASLESSAWQATLGKKALGLKVTDLAGNRVSFARASGRVFGKLLSGMTLLVGFLMAGFTARKQALHDILAGCLVLRQL